MLTYKNNNTLDGYTNVNINKNNEVVSYVYYGLGSNGRWIKLNSITANGSSTLEDLTDVSISSPLNDQVLIYTTASSLNKWTPYTISGATFNVDDITISAGSSALSSLTDWTITTPANGNLLIYNSTSSKWINTDAIPDNTLFIKDDLDGTKKMQFQLSGLTGNSTVTLAVPNASITIVGTDSTQTLTNKTLMDSTTLFRSNLYLFIYKYV